MQDRRKFRHTIGLYLGGFAVALALAGLGCSGCVNGNGATKTVSNEHTFTFDNSEQTPLDSPAREIPFDLPERIVLPSPRDDPDRWLWVNAVNSDAVGGWATASFDPDRNKIIIDTRDVEAFSIDVSKIAIDWEGLVILRLDGRNSELRKRKESVLHFVRDKHLLWAILEEPEKK